MGVIVNRRREMGGKNLPYDTEIEYLESTGTQYINLSFGFAKTDEVYTVFSVDTSMSVDKYMICPEQWNDNNNRFAMGVHSSNQSSNAVVFTCAFGNARTGITHLNPLTLNDGEIHSWSYKNNYFSITDLGIGKDVSSYTFGRETKNLKLFYGYDSNTKGKMQSYKHVKDGVVVIELIPVRVGNVGYMYDKVSGKLFGNAGTGEFILGPDR